MCVSPTPISVESTKGCCIRTCYVNGQERTGCVWRRGPYGGGAALSCGKWPVLAPRDKCNKAHYKIRKESGSGLDQ